MSEQGYLDLLSELLGGFSFTEGEPFVSGVMLASNGQVQIPVEVVAPVAVALTGSYAVITGSEINATAWRSIAYTFVAADAALDYQVMGANSSDYSDEVVVGSGSGTVNSGAVGSYSITQAPFLYYRVKCKNNSGSTSTATVRGAAKR